MYQGKTINPRAKRNAQRGNGFYSWRDTMISLFKQCAYKTCCNFFTVGRKRKFCRQWCADNDGRRNWRARNKQRVREATNKRKAKRYKEDKEFREATKHRSLKNYQAKTIDERRLIPRQQMPKEYHRKYYEDRSKNDLAFRISGVLRSRVRAAIINQGGKKSAKTIQLVGCSVPQLRKHLENQFTDGMNWDNHGAWHIDHIKPCAAFDLSNKEEQFECFHYSNVQPLWAEENMRKGATWGENK